MTLCLPTRLLITNGLSTQAGQQGLNGLVVRYLRLLEYVTVTAPFVNESVGWLMGICPGGSEPFLLCLQNPVLEITEPSHKPWLSVLSPKKQCCPTETSWKQPRFCSDDLTAIWKSEQYTCDLWRVMLSLGCCFIKSSFLKEIELDFLLHHLQDSAQVNFTNQPTD